MSGFQCRVALAGLLAVGLGLPGVAASSPKRAGQDVQIAPPKLGRSVHGTVLNAVHQPLAQAIVHLVDVSSKVGHTVITSSDGNYSFYDLKKDTTYSIYAVWKGHTSPSRIDSQYSSQNDIRLDLTIPVA
jgi:hypothetical protein